MRRAFSACGHHVDAFGHTNLCDGMRALDITDRAAVLETVCAGRYDWLINCAADRDPESCLRDPARAYRLNAAAVENLAAAASACSAKLCQISTDYVFDGTNPPYRENCAPNPVNVYGRSKLAGEYAARSTEKHLVLRVPALYRTDLSDERNVVTNFVRQLKERKELTIDSSCVRYYTQAEDVAQAAEFLLSKNICGTVHLTAGEASTKAAFCEMIAHTLDLRGCKIIPDPSPASSERRPADSHLCADLYHSLGGKPFAGISQVLASLNR